KSIFEENSVRQNDVHSEDPFGIYEVLNKKMDGINIDDKHEDSLKYLPGFTPNEEGDVLVEKVDNWSDENRVNDGQKDGVCVGQHVHERVEVSNDTHESTCSGHFKMSEVPRKGLAQKAKKDWVKELCVSYKVNLLSLQETKMEKIDLWCIKRCWGNFTFDYVYSESVEVCGFLVGRDYLLYREVVIMGDFNEVRDISERFGSIFNKHGAEAFNSFIINASLVEVSLGGCSFTWCHKSAKKMSKLDRFLISDNLMCSCPSISSTSLDRFLSDHRPIIMREAHYDYGPIPFKFFHYWFELDGFDKPISLIESLYKVRAKVLANRLVMALDDIVDEIHSAFVTNRQILDGPFILNEIVHWCKNKKKQSMIFKVDFEKAYDSGDPLSPFLFILVMESLHVSFQRVVDADLFNGIKLDSSLQISHLFYADDAIFMGQWSQCKINTIIRVLDVFYHAPGLRINMNKSNLMGISVDSNKVKHAAAKIGCLVLKTPFNYLGSRVGDLMSRIQSWHDVTEGMHTRLSKWKFKTLSIGGRLTLLKFVLGAIRIYHMSIFKVPMKVL
nr:RNA-directed DNA polymerase, eukaryota [Tanacetum cinerariifolium]